MTIEQVLVEQSQARAEALANDLYGRETDGGAKWARVADKVERTRAHPAAGAGLSARLTSAKPLAWIACGEAKGEARVIEWRLVA